MQNALLTRLLTRTSGRIMPEFRPGDTIKVHVKIKEGDKERLQAFEGTVIARTITAWARPSRSARSASARASNASSRCSTGVDHIDVVRTGRVRRAKLYYLRGLKGKAARLRERE